MSLFAQKAEVFSTGDGAIRGYDAVEYFKQGKPVKGKPENVFLWKDVKWYFASEENLLTFKADPEKYAPQYGGYCAYGLADGHKATTSPDAWTILDSKLYLNYDKDVRQLWNKNQKEYIKKADANWPKLKNKN